MPTLCVTLSFCSVSYSINRILMTNRTVYKNRNHKFNLDSIINSFVINCIVLSLSFNHLCSNKTFYDTRVLLIIPVTNNSAISEFSRNPLLQTMKADISTSKAYYRRLIIYRVSRDKPSCRFIRYRSEPIASNVFAY